MYDSCCKDKKWHSYKLLFLIVPIHKKHNLFYHIFKYSNMMYWANHADNITKQIVNSSAYFLIMSSMFFKRSDFLET